MRDGGEVRPQWIIFLGLLAFILGFMVYAVVLWR